MGEASAHKEEEMKIKVRYLRDIPLLEVLEKGDWVGLRAAEDVRMKRVVFESAEHLKGRNRGGFGSTGSN